MAAIATLSYAARLTALGPQRPDLFFRWSTVATTAVLDGLVLALAVLIARGLPFREALALRRPRSWRDAGTIAAGALAAIYAVSLVEEVALGHASREQAVAPFWDPARLDVFIANAIAVAVLAPIVEESLCRGIGFHLLSRYGDRIAVVGSALAFALAHGAVTDLPWVFVTGLGLGYLRSRSASLYPGILLHGLVNAVAVVASAALASPL